MRSARLLSAALVLLLAALPLSANDKAYTAYIEGAQAVVGALKSGAEPASQAAALQALVEHAERLIDPFSERYPACAAYLAASRRLSAQWAELSLQQIEQDYHHDGALPAIDDPAKRALCYQMKDLLVHPLTALRMLAETPVNRAGVEHEIVEVIAHGRALRTLMAR